MHQLLDRILREFLAGLLLDELLVFDDDLFQRLGLEFVVELDVLAMLDAVEDVLELLLADIQDDAAEHLDQAAIGVVGKAGIARCAGRGLRRNGR